MKTDNLYKTTKNNSTGLTQYVYLQFEYDDNSRFGAYYKPKSENQIVVIAKPIDGTTPSNLSTYQALSADGYVSEPIYKVPTPRELYGYPQPLVYGNFTDTIEDVSFPIFRTLDDFNYYVETGDDSNAVNYADLHSTKADFYLTNNGERVTIKHKWTDPTQPNTKISEVDYNFKESIFDTQKTFVKVGDDIDLSKSWNELVGNPLVITLDVTITAYGGSGIKLCELSATIKRKRLMLGEVSAVVNVAESNGYHLYATTNNSFDDIGADSDDNSDAKDNENNGSQFGGFSNLCTTYQLSTTALNDLGDFIWNNSIFDNIKNMNNSPLENIVSCHYLPYAFGGVQSPIVIGNVETNVTGVKLSQNMIKKNYASFEVPKVNVGFLGYEPYTSISLYLPLVGMVELSTNDVCGYTINVDYAFDFVVGSFSVLVYTSKGGGKTLIYSTQGTCAVDIPLTASNKAQVQTAILQSGISLVADAGTKNVGGAINDLTSIATIQNHSTRFGSPSSMVGALSPTTCYYVLRTPILNLPQSFAHDKGFICMETYSLKDLKGFTKLTNDVDLSGFDCTYNELQRLRSILTSGFYL